MHPEPSTLCEDENRFSYCSQCCKSLEFDSGLTPFFTHFAVTDIHGVKFANIFGA